MATTAIVAGILGEEYTLKDAAMAAVTGAVGALGWQAQVGVAVTSGVYNLGAAAIKGEDIDTALQQRRYLLQELLVVQVA